MHPDAVYARYILSLFDSFLYNILRGEALEILSFIHCDNVRKERLNIEEGRKKVMNGRRGSEE